jgi:hypothetical protein
LDEDREGIGRQLLLGDYLIDWRANETFALQQE